MGFVFKQNERKDSSQYSQLWKFNLLEIYRKK